MMPKPIQPERQGAGHYWSMGHSESWAPQAPGSTLHSLRSDGWFSMLRHFVSKSHRLNVVESGILSVGPWLGGARSAFPP